MEGEPDDITNGCKSPKIIVNIQLIHIHTHTNTNAHIYTRKFAS